MQHVMKRPSVHRTPHGAYQTLQHYVADLIYGTNDGILTTFAIVAGVSGGDLSSSAVLIVGVANLFADGLSMGVGNYLSIRARESALEAQHLPEEEAYPVRHGLAHILGLRHCRRDSPRAVSYPRLGPSLPLLGACGPCCTIHRRGIALAGNGESVVGQRP